MTGASGFVGAALAQALLRDGHRVVSIVRDRTRLAYGHAVVYGDVRDEDVCRRAIADYAVTTIYHLAAQSIVSSCAEDPVAALDVATLGTARLLQAARTAGRPIKVVCSTSDKVFGSSPSPYTEATPLDARHAYEVSKACQDLVARMFFHNYGMDVRVVRAVNIYGPADPNESRVVPQTILRLLRGDPPLLHAGAGAMRRQYVYIDDVVQAFRVVADRGSPGEVYCVGSPSPPLSVLEVIAEITRQVDGEDAAALQRLEVKERFPGFHEIQEQSAIDDKIRLLDWVPNIAFEEGIAKTIAWYRQKWTGTEALTGFDPTGTD